MRFFLIKTTSFLLTICIVAGIFASPTVFSWRKELLLSQNTNSSPQITVVLDAGHGGEDGGAVNSNGVAEKGINLSITLKIAQYLKDADIPFILTRSDDTMLYDHNSDVQGKKKVQDILKRKEITESVENPLFVSIHLNSFPQSKYHGLQVWYSPNHPDSCKFANLLQEKAATQFQIGNEREIKAAGSSIYLLHHLQCPAVLVECGFLTNPEEAEKLQNEEYQQALAFLIFLSILAYQDKA